MAIADESNSKQVSGKPPILAGRDARPVEDFEALLGSGGDLWADDAEFEAFLAELYRWRKSDRGESRAP